MSDVRIEEPTDYSEMKVCDCAERCKCELTEGSEATSEDDDGSEVGFDMDGVEHQDDCESDPATTAESSGVESKVTGCKMNSTDDALLNMFFLDFQPLSIVEDVGFKELIQVLNPSYHLPSPQTILNTLIPAKYGECLRATASKLESASTVCITTDCWTSESDDSCMAVMAHFIDANYEIHGVLLDCASFPNSHTPQNLADTLKEIVEKWKLSDKVVFAVSNHVTNISLAVEIELGWESMDCSAQSLHSMIKGGLSANESVANILDKIRAIVSHFQSHRKAMDKLKIYQKQHKPDFRRRPKKLFIDVSDSWYSTFRMLRRFVLLHEAIEAALTPHPGPTAFEWRIVGELTKVLALFQTYGNYMGGSMLIPASSCLLSACRKLKSQWGLTPEVESVLNFMYERVQYRLISLESNMALCLATFLDPRFKDVSFSDKDTAGRVRDEAISLVQWLICKNNEVAILPSAPLEPPTSPEQSFWSYFDGLLERAKPRTYSSLKSVSLRRAVQEVNLYLYSRCLRRREDPFLWWKEKFYVFPHLHELFRKYFCCQTTSVPCEKIFSKMSLLIGDEEVNELEAEERAKMLLFLNQNESNRKTALQRDASGDTQLNLEIEKLRSRPY